MEEEKKEKGFVIKDRRHFDESGDVRDEKAARLMKEERKEAEVEEAGTTPEEAGRLRNGRNTPSRDQFRQFHLLAQYDRHVSLRRLSRSRHEEEPAKSGCRQADHRYPEHPQSENGGNLTRTKSNSWTASSMNSVCGSSRKRRKNDREDVAGQGQSHSPGSREKNGRLSRHPVPDAENQSLR